MRICVFGTVGVDCKSNLYSISQSVADKYIVGFFHSAKIIWNSLLKMEQFAFIYKKYLKSK